jgi:hypothetical protein
MFDLLTRAEVIDDLVDEVQKLTNEIPYRLFLAFAETIILPSSP